MRHNYGYNYTEPDAIRSDVIPGSTRPDPTAAVQILLESPDDKLKNDDGGMSRGCCDPDG